jgi:hypothetical protein
MIILVFRLRQPGEEPHIFHTIPLIGIVLAFLNMIFIWNTMQKIRSGVIEYMFLQITLFDDKLTSQDQIAVRYTLKYIYFEFNLSKHDS